MRFNAQVRRWHYWVSIASALPMLILIGSGLLLQFKKHWSWVQPCEQRGTGSVPQLSLDEMLAILTGTPGLNITGWESINRMELRPAKGMAKVRLHSGYEVQMDLGTGAILQHEYRRSDIIESIHDGSIFAGNWTKLGVFLPTGLLLLFLWASGLVLFWLPISVRRRRKRLGTL